MITFVLLGLYAIPTAIFATFAVRLDLQTGLILPMVLLAFGLLASPTRQVRAALASAFSQEHVRAAQALDSQRRKTLHPIAQTVITLFKSSLRLARFLIWHLMQNLQERKSARAGDNGRKTQAGEALQRTSSLSNKSFNRHFIENHLHR